MTAVVERRRRSTAHPAGDGSLTSDASTGRMAITFTRTASDAETMHRRRLLAACATTGALAGVAGCQNPEAATDGDVATNEVDGLAVTNHVGDTDAQQFAVEMDVENVGNQDTDAQQYDYGLTPYDENGEDVSDGGKVVDVGDGSTDLPAGETIEVEVEVDTSINAASVDRYELSITCSPFHENAPYCAN